MTYRIDTKNKGGVVKITINNDTNILIKGYDPEVINRVFFKREIRSRGKETYSFGVPIASKYIDVFIKESIPSKELGFKVEKIEYDKLIQPILYADRLTEKFINFATNFAFNVCHYPPGIYIDKDKLFKIRILPKIDGTPARINVVTNLIEVSKTDLDDKTVAAIAWLLFHEFGHNFQSNDPDSEFEADFHADDLFLACGYPKIEGFKVIASFYETEQNRERLQQTEDIFLNNNK